MRPPVRGRLRETNQRPRRITRRGARTAEAEGRAEEITPEEQNEIRRYLLGQLSEADEEAVELRLLAEDDYFELSEIVGDELLDAYVHDALPAAERELLEARFLRAPERRRQLAFAATLGEEIAARSARAGEATEKAAAHSARAEQSQSAGQSAGAGQSQSAEHSAGAGRKVVPFAPRARRFPAPAYLKIAAALIVAVGAGFAVWRMSADNSAVPRAMAALNVAHKDQRLVEARISELDYAPTRQLRGGAPPTVDRASRNLAETLLLEAIAKRPDAAAHHALGRVYLAEGKFDLAQENFEKSLAQGRADARLHADLGAVLLERGRAERQNDAGKGSVYFGQSLEHLNRALQLDAALPEALFNRALLYQQLLLTTQAREAWRAYLERDSASPWAAEARRNLQLLDDEERQNSQQGARLHESFAAAFRAGDGEAAWAAFGRARARAGNLVTERLLDEHLEHAARGRDAEAADKLRMLTFAGELELARAGDRYTADLAAAYGRADGARRELLAHARGLKRRGSERYDKSEYAAAAALFAEAARAFEQAGGGGEALHAESWIGYSELRDLEVDQSRRRFERLSAAFEGRGYKSLQAQSLHALGDARTSENELSQALDYARRALALSEQIGDDVTRLRCLQLFVSMHRIFSHHAESLKYGMEAIELARGLPFDPKLVWPFYHEAADNFQRLELRSAALEFEREALRLAEVSGWPVIISRSHSRLGVIHEARGEHDAALERGLRAVEAGRGVEEEKSRFGIISHASMRLGHLYRQRGDYDRALACYDEALWMFDQLGKLDIYLYETRKGKFLAHAGRGDEAAAERELAEALRHFDRYRDKILEERNRDSFFHAEQDTYDLAINFAHARANGAERAFDYAETSRARSLLNLLHASARARDGGGNSDSDGDDDGGNSDGDGDSRDSDDGDGPAGTRIAAHPLPLKELYAHLPARAQLLQYSVLGDQLIIWVVTREGVESRAHKITAGELGRKVDAYLRRVAAAGGGDDAGTEAAARELYAVLVGPVEDLLSAGKLLCVVPDKILSHLPFAALVSPEGKFLVEKHTLVVAPSANVFAACTKRAAEPGRHHAETLLSVGNPDFARRQFPGLADLPAAAREARQVARFYNASPLVGAAARESRVRAAMPGADIIHLASHYVAEEDSPLRSKLLLADEGRERPSGAGGPDGVLQASEVYGMELPRTRLVVLSACQTGVEQSLRGEGAIGMARSFLSTGVPLVVASLWPVETDATADLMIKFHGYRKHGGLTSAEALRKAQQDMIRDPDAAKRRPHAWASFVAYGGHEESKP